jgi:hypothetical protein
LLRPFTVLSNTVKGIFQYQGIQITETMTLGDALGSMASEKLSSGEKHMLSFLCYNAFINNSIILIDEPEYSCSKALKTNFWLQHIRRLFTRSILIKN